MAVEIEEAQLQALQNAYGLLNKLYGDPKHGMAFKKLLKDHNPNLSIPEIDAAAPHVARLDEIEKTTKAELDETKKQLAEFIRKQQEEREEADLESRLRQVKTDNDLTDEGLEKVKKLMVERKIADPEAAAALLLRKEPAAPLPPSGFVPRRWNFGVAEKDDASAQHLLADPEGWMEEEAARIWSESQAA